MSLSIRQNNFTIVPTNLNEAIVFADMIAKSSFCPAAMKGKGGDILIAMQMGAEVGLSPMQALQNIAVINGRPTLWGDAALAVVMAHPQYVSHREWTEGSLKDKTMVAYCAVTRKNSEEYIKSFSIEEAENAGLWGKAGPWKQYPQRMLQMRARAFAIRDKFADALRGISMREEVQDYEVIKAKKNVVNIKEDRVAITVEGESSMTDEIVETETVVEPPFRDIEKDLLDISWCDSMDDLEEKFKAAYKYAVYRRDTESVKRLIDAKDKKKLELSESVNAETGEVKDE